MFFYPLVTSVLFSNSIKKSEPGKPELRVYSYRVNPKEHPDFKLTHFERINRSHQPRGLDFMNSP